MIGKTLDEGSTFERMGSRQLAGLLIAVWSVLFSFPLITSDKECSFFSFILANTLYEMKKSKCMSN